MDKDKFQFLLDQRRKFIKEITALSGLALVTGAELCRAAPVSITGDRKNDDKNWGTVKGKIKFEGDIPKQKEVSLEGLKIPPKDMEWFRSAGPILEEDWVVNKENRGVQWVVVWLIPDNAPKNKNAKLEVHEKFKAPLSEKERFVIVDQDPKGYVPHTVAIHEGIGIKLRNKGPVAHVFQLTSFKNKMPVQNMAPNTEIDLKDFKADRSPNKFTCTPHPWEAMWLRIFDHPYYAVTNADGEFEIKNAPAGPCRIVVWQEEIGFKDQGRQAKFGDQIKIEGGAETDLGDITIKVKVAGDAK